MKTSLDRFYRLRVLLEDTSRMELEVRLKEISQVERGVQTLREERRGALRKMDWREAMVMVELALRQEQMLGNILREKLDGVDRAKSEYLERRKERRQAESVIAAYHARISLGRSRKEQQAIDDWFGQKVWRKRT
jgi:flagellar biosynthesis chaperone FliJ